MSVCHVDSLRFLQENGRTDFGQLRRYYVDVSNIKLRSGIFRLNG